jgi:diguanylate cyclase (GGDEF)-like protein
LLKSAPKLPIFIRIRNFVRDMALYLKGGRDWLYDGLTSLYTRKAFEAFALGMLSMSVRTGTPVSVIMADADGLKAINDDPEGKGHPDGDRFLRESAEVMKAHLRGSDIIGRYGGDEYIIIALADFSGALTLAKKLGDELNKNSKSWSFGVEEIKTPDPELTKLAGKLTFSPTEDPLFSSWEGIRDKAITEADNPLKKSLDLAIWMADQNLYNAKSAKGVRRH